MTLFQSVLVGCLQMACPRTKKGKQLKSITTYSMSSGILERAKSMPQFMASADPNEEEEKKEDVNPTLATDTTYD